MRFLFCFLVSFSAFIKCNSEYTETVRLPQGDIRGSVNEWRGKSAYEFKGIPFASPPVDSLRYSKPIEPKPWKGVRDTISYGKSCPQNAWAIKFEDTDEDCLYLNVYVNKETFDNRNEQLKPVLFWIHGGGFQVGSGNEHDAYNGVPLVIVEDVLLVTINYRLGVLGFLAEESLYPSLVPNLGLWDQNFALKWAANNIHLFGGDPNRITIFGQSAGSISVAYHVLSPQSRGLFRGAIMESGGVINVNENMTKATESFIESVNCKNASDKLSCLRSIPWDELLANSPKIFLPPIFGDEFLPKTSEEAIVSGQFNDVDLLVGAVRDEGSVLICSTYKFAVLKASNSTKATYGYFATQPPTRPFGSFPFPSCGRKVDKVCHCDELVYVFGAPLIDPAQYDADDIELSINVMKIWADFARTGEPTKQGPVDWPQIGDKNKVNLIDLNNKFIGKIDETTGTSCLAE